MKKQTPRQRFQEIVGVFTKYGFKQGITDPSKLRQALEELGPTFIKIAQILSTRPDIMPQAYIEEFQKLQDDARPHQFDDIAEIIKRDLGDKSQDIVVDPHPMASASIAQVHQGRLPNGNPVIIKVKRPGIEEKIFNDLNLMKQMSRVFRFLPHGNIWNLSEVVDELRDALKLELNFRHEGDNIRKFREFHSNIKYVRIPQLYPQFTSRDVLVMEYIQGIKVSERSALTAAGYDPEETAVKLVYNFMLQIFAQGLFHADLHPGNILISNNKIVFLDFGLVGQLSERMLNHFNKLLMSIVLGDVDAMVTAIIHIGVKKGPLDRAVLRWEVEHIYNQYITASIYDIDVPDLLGQIFRICRQNNLAFPRDITLLVKGILALEGTINRLSPNTNLVDLMAPYIQKQITKSRNPGQELHQLGVGLYRMTRASMRIPERLLEILNGIAAGSTKVRMEHIHLEEFSQDLKKSLNRLVFALIVAALIIGSSLIVATESGPQLFDVSVLGIVGYLGAGLMGLWLLISILRSGKI